MWTVFPLLIWLSSILGALATSHQLPTVTMAQPIVSLGAYQQQQQTITQLQAQTQSGTITQLQVHPQTPTHIPAPHTPTLPGQGQITQIQQVTQVQQAKQFPVSQVLTPGAQYQTIGQQQQRFQFLPTQQKWVCPLCYHTYVLLLYTGIFSPRVLFPLFYIILKTIPTFYLFTHGCIHKEYKSCF